MSEHGFYHPDRGYWQTITAPSADVLASFPPGTIGVPLPPANGGVPKYSGGVFSWEPLPPPPEIIPESVSARQFKLQLLTAGLLDGVDAWVSQQGKATQIAYQYSSSFVKSEPMMQAGFTAMGFTPEQIDAFYLAASKL